jgi:hypothetical protein
VNTEPQIFSAEGKSLWHIVIDLAYESKGNDSYQDGVNSVLLALSPLIENGGGIKRVRIMSLPEK